MTWWSGSPTTASNWQTHWLYRHRRHWNICRIKTCVRFFCSSGLFRRWKFLWGPWHWLTRREWGSGRYIWHTKGHRVVTRTYWPFAASEVSPVYSENSTILISHIYDLIRSHISLLFYSCLVPLAVFICWLGTDIVVFPCGCFLLKSFPGTSSTILGFNSSLVSVFEFGARTSFVLGNSTDLQRACFSILVGLDRFWSCSFRFLQWTLSGLDSISTFPLLSG